MKISIITATYNSAETIVDTIRSVESQTYEDIEYIVIDGASKDNTLELVKKHCSRLALVKSEPDLGIYDALNKGISLATGDMIGFLHSDDIFAYPDAIADMVECVKVGDGNAIYADLNYVDKSNIDIVTRRWVSGVYSSGKLNFGWMPPHPTFYMCRNLYNQLGGFDLDYKICSDYDSVLRYFKSNMLRVCYMNKVMIKMRTGGASNNSLKNAVRKLREELLILKRNNVLTCALVFKKLTKLNQWF